MADYAVVTKVIIHNRRVDEDESVEGSYAKKVSDYLEGINNQKVIHSIHSVELSGGSIMTVIIHAS